MKAFDFYAKTLLEGEHQRVPIPSGDNIVYNMQTDIIDIIILLTVDIGWIIAG